MYDFNPVQICLIYYLFSKRLECKWPCAFCRRQMSLVNGNPAQIENIISELPFFLVQMQRKEDFRATKHDWNPMLTLRDEIQWLKQCDKLKLSFVILLPRIFTVVIKLLIAASSLWLGCMCFFYWVAVYWYLCYSSLSRGITSILNKSAFRYLC